MLLFFCNKESSKQSFEVLEELELLKILSFTKQSFGEYIP